MKILNTNSFYKILISLLLLTPITFGFSNSKSLRFAFLTDLHVVPGNDNERALASVVDEINQDSLRFVVVTGDITNMGKDTELMACKNLLDRLTIPYYIIPGNHETTWSESAGRTFARLWGADRFVLPVDEYLFIAFSTGPYSKMGDGHVKAEDILWLERELSKAENKNKKVISLQHYPLEDGLGNWNRVVAVLKNHNTIASLCGHGHALRLYNWNNIPGVMGRALIDRDKNIGYNIAELSVDSLIVREKILNTRLQPVNSLAVDYITKNCISQLSFATYPNFFGGDLPANVHAELIIEEDASIFTGVAIHNNIIFYGNSQGWLKAYDYKKKKELWSVSLSSGPVFSTPLYADGLIIVGSIENKIASYDANTGMQKWCITTNSPVVNDGAIQGKYLYMGAGSSLFLKIKLKTGNLCWRYDSVQGAFQGAPALSNDKVVFGAWDQYLYCLDASTGLFNWKWSNGTKVDLYSPGNVVPVVTDNKVIIVAPDRYMTAIDLKSGHQLWRSNKYKVRESLGYSAKQKAALAKTMDGELIAVSTEATQYTDLWKVDTGIGYEHNPCPNVVSDGVVYLGSREGLIVAVDEISKQVLWKHKCGNSSINKISIDTKGAIWVSLIEGKIMRFTQK